MEGQCLNENSTNVMKNLLEQALESNESSVSTWIGYKKDLENVKTNMKNYSEKLTVPIMIPLCSKAMIPGRLVHTNQVLVSLGDIWFSKVSTKNAMEHCDRRIELCSDMIKKYEKEKSILDSRLNFPADDEGKEIIEPYNDEEMEKWREEHREMEKKYHKEKKREETQTQASVAEEELWRKLDELELQEELEDQLLLENEDDGEEEDDEEEEEEEEKDSGHSSDDDTSEVIVSSNRTVINESEPLQQHVPTNSSSSADNDNIIRFTHTDVPSKPISYCTESPYQTPACIYKDYLKRIGKGDSNGKKVQFNIEEAPRENSDSYSESSTVRHDAILKNITETQAASSSQGPSRPVSKFKQSRKS